MSLKGKVAVVTGASRGIGRGVALQLGAAGAKVYITGRDPKNRKVDPKFPTLEQTAKGILLHKQLKGTRRILFMYVTEECLYASL